MSTFCVEGHQKQITFWIFCTDLVTKSEINITRNHETELQGLVILAEVLIIW